MSVGERSMRRKYPSISRGVHPPERAPATQPAPFDAEAGSFDTRAGLPESVKCRVAETVLALADVPVDAIVLDLGAGTGQIGFELGRIAPRYVGLDSSREMLAAFRARCEEADRSLELIVGDAREQWPMPPRSVGLVFGSRALHWLTPTHLVAETLRTAHPRGSSLIVGRIVRAPTDPRRAVRRELQRRLAEAGFVPRRSEAHAREVVEVALRRGASPIGEQTVARFERTATLQELFDGWRERQGLGGVEGALPDFRRRLLDELEQWASKSLGDLDSSFTAVEEYTVRGARFPPQI